MPHHYGWAPKWEVGGIDLSLTNAVLNMWLAAAITVVVFWVAASKSRLIPKGIQTMVEVSMDFVKDQLVYSVMNPKDGKTWFPFIATTFFFILFMNSAGLIPWIGYTPTATIWVTMTLAIGVYLVAVVIGMIKHGPITFWKQTLIPQGLPGKNRIMKAIGSGFFLVIEFISQLARPFSLGVRLFANMLADHIILLIFVGFIFLVGTSFAIGHVLIIPVSIVLEVVFYAFAMFVAFIQAVIFAFLTSIYINDALHPGH
jgi:F-type H+-transporting ATPase subunit a